MLAAIFAVDWYQFWPFRPPEPQGLISGVVKSFIQLVYWSGVRDGAVVTAIVLILIYLVAQMLRGERPEK